MKKIPTWLLVVAVALRDDAGRILLQERPAGKHHAGLWEFPGGKVETAETPREALVRELDEELGLRLDASTFQPAGFAEEGADPRVVLILYTSPFGGEPVEAMDGQLFGWFTAKEAQELPLAPMDRQLLCNLAD